MIRISDGLPRGGLGYAGLLSTLVALLLGVLTDPGTAVLITALLAPLSIWCGIGLRRDSDNDEAYDLIIYADTEGQSLFDWLLGKSRTRSYRLSSLMYLGSAAAVGIAVVRLLNENRIRALPLGAIGRVLS